MDESNAQPQYTEIHLEKTAQETTLNGGHQPSDSEHLSASPSLDAEKVEKPAANPWTDPQSFPDGGAKAWLTVAGASACLFVSFGWINCVGVFQDYYQTHQLKQYSPSNIAWIPALQVFFMLFGGPFVGKIFDDYGPRYLLAGGTFLHVFGLMMTSISKKYYQFLLAQAVCSAIGASMVFYPAFTCASTWFYEKRGAALGLVAAGSSLGGVILPIMVVKLISEVGFGGMFIPVTFLVVEARLHGMSSSLANYLVAILNGASIIGRTVPNAIADKVGRFNVMIIMSCFTTILILALWLPATGHAPIILFAVLFGISSGAGISLTPVLCATISPMKDIGVRTGTIYAISSIAALTGSPIGGQIIGDSHGSFRNTQIFSGVSCALGAALFVAARISLGGAKMTKV